MTSEPVRKVVMEDGLRLITEYIPAVRSVSVGFWIIGGSQSEGTEENGITHFIEHMLFKGTPTRNAYDIAREIDSLGGHLDAFTSREYTCLMATVLDEHLPRVIDILTDQLNNSIFDEQELDRERDVVLEEIKTIEDTPDELVHDLCIQNFWPDQPLGRPIIGSQENVQRFTRRNLCDYFVQNYVPGQIIVTAAGNVQHDSLKEFIQKKNLKKSFPARVSSGSNGVSSETKRVSSDSNPASVSSGSKKKASECPVAHHQVVFLQKKLEQVHLCLATAGIPQSHPLRFAGYLMNFILGGGMSSRLFQKIREQRGLAYSVYSSFQSYQDAGLGFIYAGMSAGSFSDTLRLILEELTILKEQKVTSEELQRGKDQLKGSLMLGLESTANRMGKLARQEIYFNRNFSLNEILLKIEQVTQEDILELADLLFRTENLALTVLGDFTGIKKWTLEDLRC